MRVALFVHRYPPATGGAESYAARLAAFHTSRGDPVDVWTSTALDLGAMTGRGRHLPKSRAAIRRYRPLRFPGRRLALKALSLVPHRTWQCLTRPANPTCPAMWHDAGRVAIEYDVVHALAFPHSFPAICGLRLARRLNIPFVITPFLHLGDPDDAADPTRRQYTAPPLRWLLCQAECVFAQTEFERQAVINMGVAKSRVVRQGLGVDVQECTGGDRMRARSGWNVHGQNVVVGHLANLSVEKGTVDLLAALRGMSAPPRVMLAGPAMPNFTRVWDRNVHPTVSRLGPLTEMGKRDFFAGIDVFCLPSLSDSFGLVLLEAWANGKPVIVYRAGGPAELVRPRLDGLQVRAGDIAGLAGAISELVANDALRVRLGEAGRERVTAGEFDWTQSLTTVTDQLAALIN